HRDAPHELRFVTVLQQHPFDRCDVALVRELDLVVGRLHFRGPILQNLHNGHVVACRVRTQPSSQNQHDRSEEQQTEHRPHASRPVRLHRSGRLQHIQNQPRQVSYLTQHPGPPSAPDPLPSGKNATRIAGGPGGKRCTLAGQILWITPYLVLKEQLGQGEKFVKTEKLLRPSCHSAWHGRHMPCPCDRPVHAGGHSPQLTVRQRL